MNRDQIISPRAVEGLIAQGGIIVIFEDYVLKLDSWLEKHPGGRLAILHMVGKDATDEITVYHSAATLKTMKAYRIGRKPTGPWLNMTPPIRGGIYRPLQLEGTLSTSSTPISLLAADDNDTVAAEDAVASLPSGVSAPHHPGTSSTTAGEAPAPACITLNGEEDEGLLLCTPPPALSAVRRRFARRQSDAAGPTDRRPGQDLCPLLLPVDDHDRYGSDSGYDTASRRDEEEEPDSEVVTVAEGSDTTDSVPTKCPVEYTDWAMQQGVYHDLRDYPSLAPAVQQDIVYKYRLLHQQIQKEGLYDCRYIEYGKEMVRYLSLFAVFLVAIRHGWYMTGAVFLGLFWHQIMFTAHDAGHHAITHNPVVDSLIGMFIADFCCGLSIGWWKSSHNVHHLVTNQPEHDPDIQNVPLFATCPSFFKSIHSTYYDFSFVWDAVANFMVPYQQYTYYPIMGIARFNLYLLSWLHVLSSKSSSLGNSKAYWIRPTEIAFMFCYWLIFGYGLLWCTLPTWTIRVAFVLVSHIITMPLHVQITLSHWGMSTSDLGEAESFPQRQLRTTMDVDCPAWLDFIHGGLQFQTAHHMFPRVPRHNLRRAQALCMQFSKDTGIPYSIMGFVDGNRKVMSRLGQVGEQVRILISCQKYMAETGESGLH